MNTRQLVRRVRVLAAGSASARGNRRQRGASSLMSSTSLKAEVGVCGEWKKRGAAGKQAKRVC